jgi:D-aspartate ligase
MSDMRRSRAVACVIGDMDLVRPLGLARIPCVVVATRGAPSRFSRFAQAVVDWGDAWEQPEELVEKLVRFGNTMAEPPVLFYENDPELLLISRHRERLRQAFRFVIAEATLVEDLVDKSRFQGLAERLGLPVPPTRCLSPGGGSSAADLDLRFPIVIKMLTRRMDQWRPLAGQFKARQVDSREELRNLWPSLAAAHMDVIAQEVIPGPESCIESYHVYVDELGNIVGEFTGRKIRTYPERHGYSTALVITDTPDVAALGRELVGRLHLSGVAKFDFKRAPDGKLYLLEVNPRFTLWNHPGAVAGVNLPALVYGDMVGLPRAVVRRARPGVRWCIPWQDFAAARATGMPLRKWLRWAIACETKRTVAIDDPMPLLRGGICHWFSRADRHEATALKEAQWA